MLPEIFARRSGLWRNFHLNSGGAIGAAHNSSVPKSLGPREIHQTLNRLESYGVAAMAEEMIWDKNSRAPDPLG